MTRPRTPSPVYWDSADPALPAIRQDGRPEPARANRALLDYLRLGPARTIPDLHAGYRAQPNPPTASYETLRFWSADYEWTRRAAEYDQLEEKRLKAETAARRASILQTGFALDHERVRFLNLLFEKLSALLEDENALWINDVKSVYLGEGQFERVETRRFNDDLIRLLRALLADLASETGGRQLPPPAPEPAPKPALEWEKYSLEALTSEERTELIRLLDKAAGRDNYLNHPPHPPVIG